MTKTLIALSALAVSFAAFPVATSTDATAAKCKSGYYWDSDIGKCVRETRGSN